MLLDLSRIRSPRERYEKVYQPDALGGEPDNFRIVAPVSLAFDIVKDKQQFRLTGSVATTLELRCSRCLEPFEWSVDARFDVWYQPRAEGAPGAGEDGGEHEIQDDDLAMAVYDDETIDLGQLMREQFYLGLPMKPLCHDGCRGLCPTCGTNLNSGTCECKREWEDPRFAVLKKLTAES